MKNWNQKKHISAFIVLSALFFIFSFSVFHLVYAATNIVAAPTTDHWSWNDVITWMDWYNTNTIIVDAHKLTGYASSSYGDISLNCDSTSIGNICSPQNGNYGVVNIGGDLSGWAWNDIVGWISFSCNNIIGSCVSQQNYHVQINADTGDFSGWAWNDLVGWISFNCLDAGSCGPPNNYIYKVNTDWRATSTSGYVESSTFDTGVALGAQIVSVLWQGSLPPPAGEAAVRFQFAVSNDPAGPWNFVGPDGTANDYYSASPNTSIRLDIKSKYYLFNNERYFRYRVTLVSNKAQSASPKVDEIIVHVSP